MRSKWKNFVLSWKIQKKINAANQILTSQRIKLKQLHLNSLNLLQKKQEFSFLQNTSLPLLSSSSVIQNNSSFSPSNFSLPPQVSLKKTLNKFTSPLKSSFFKSKKSYFFFKKINKIENKKFKKYSLIPTATPTISLNPLNEQWSAFKHTLSGNDPDIQNIIDVERYTGILSNRPIILKNNNFNIPLDSVDIVFNITSYITSRFLLIKEFMIGHKFGEFLFNRKLGKKKSKKKSKK